MNKGLNNMNDMVRRAQQMQRDLAKARDAVKDRVVAGRAGGDLVTVMVNGAREVVNVKLDPKIDVKDLALLEDLLLVAMNDALKKCEEMIAKETSKATGGLDVSGLL